MVGGPSSPRTVYSTNTCKSPRTVYTTARWSVANLFRAGWLFGSTTIFFSVAESKPVLTKLYKEISPIQPLQLAITEAWRFAHTPSLSTSLLRSTHDPCTVSVESTCASKIALWLLFVSEPASVPASARVPSHSTSRMVPRSLMSWIGGKMSSETNLKRAFPVSDTCLFANSVLHSTKCLVGGSNILDMITSDDVSCK